MPTQEDGMESQEKIDAAKKAVYLTKEQREKQTQDFLAKIDAQRKNGEIPGKPVVNDNVKK
jgi:sulfur transfer protein SufE